ncbi:MAG: nucleotidyltransferase [candidate division WOR-3 bacterium]
MKIEKDYEEFLKLLNKNKVKYVIVGAFALALYSNPRYTKDLDIFVEPAVENGKRLLKVLNEFGFKNLELKEEDFTVKNQIIQLGYEPVRIDLMTSIPGCSFEEVWNNKIAEKYGRTRVYFIGKRELIKSKKASGRKQDIADLELLEKTEI